jgi:hypothetical protein
MPRPDFADPDNRTCIALLTHADDPNNLEIVLGVSIHLRRQSLHSAAKQARGALRVWSARPTLHLSKSPNQLWLMGDRKWY